MELCDRMAELTAPFAPQHRGQPAARVARARSVGEPALRMPAHPPGNAWRAAEPWHMLFHGTWEYDEHSNVLEARAAGMAVRRLLRSRASQGSK
eukprot:8072829-Alexandrium_andersonii.AAC.1